MQQGQKDQKGLQVLYITTSVGGRTCTYCAWVIGICCCIYLATNQHHSHSFSSKAREADGDRKRYISCVQVWAITPHCHMCPILHVCQPGTLTKKSLMCNCKVLSYLKILHGVYVVNNRRTVLTNSVICNANGNGCRQQPMFTGLLQTTHFGSRRNLVSKAIPATDLVLMGFCRKLSMCTQLHAQFLSTNTGSPREVCSGSCGVRPSEFEKQVQETRSKEIIGGQADVYNGSTFVSMQLGF